MEIHDEATLDEHSAAIRVNGGDNTPKDVKIVSRQTPTWLSYSTPDEFVVWTPLKTSYYIFNVLVYLV